MPKPLRAFAQQGHHDHFQGRASNLRPFDHLWQPDELWWSILPWICRWTVVRFFLLPYRPDDLHEGAVQRYGLNLKPEDLLFLQGSKDTRQHSLFGPPAHPGVDRMPTAEVLGKAPPLAAVLKPRVGWRSVPGGWGERRCRAAWRGSVRSCGIAL